MVLKWRRCNRRTKSVVLSEIKKVILLDRRLKWRPLFDKIGHQLSQPFWIHHGAGQDVSTNGGALLDNSDFNLAQWLGGIPAFGGSLIVSFDQSGQVQRPAQVRRSRP